MLQSLITEYKDIFAETNAEMGRTNMVEHEIDVQESQPIKSKPYKVSQWEREIIDKQLQEMLETNVIRPSQSPWASPVVLVKKKDGSPRFRVDHRKVNAVTMKSSYPLPSVDDVLSYVGDAEYYTSLDLCSGYWQVGIAKDYKEITAFTVQGHGLYEFNVLPFGLCNALCTFQNLTDMVFEGMKYKEIIIYLDDILVFSKTFEEHIIRLRKVFDRLRNARHFVKEEIDVLGHRIDKHGTTPNGEKIKAIKDFLRSKSTKTVQSFVGLCGFYRKYVRDFANIAKPLYEATKKEGFI